MPTATIPACHDPSRVSRRTALLRLSGAAAGGVVAVACGSAASTDTRAGSGAPTAPEASSTSTSTAPAPATVVLVHGAWHRPDATWDLVRERLTASGVPSIAVDLPSAGPDPTGARPGLAEDAAAVAVAIAEVDGPVVLVGHSYGGMVISAAGADPSVRGLVYLAAFCLEEGETVLDIAAVDPPPPIAFAIRYTDDGLMTIDPPQATEVFYADVDPGLAASSVERLVPSTATVFSTPQGPPAWRDKESLYVVCEQDNAIPPRQEQMMATRCSRSVTLAAGHSPFLSMPDRVAELLVAEAGADR